MPAKEHITVLATLSMTSQRKQEDAELTLHGLVKSNDADSSFWAVPEQLSTGALGCFYRFKYGFGWSTFS